MIVKINKNLENKMEKMQDLINKDLEELKDKHKSAETKTRFAVTQSRDSGQKRKVTTQMKEQTRNTEVQINEEEIGKLPEKELRIMTIKMIKKPENKREKMQESI